MRSEAASSDRPRPRSVVKWASDEGETPSLCPSVYAATDALAMRMRLSELRPFPTPAPRPTDPGEMIDRLTPRRTRNMRGASVRLPASLEVLRTACEASIAPEIHLYRIRGAPTGAFGARPRSRQVFHRAYKGRIRPVLQVFAAELAPADLDAQLALQDLPEKRVTLLLERIEALSHQLGLDPASEQAYVDSIARRMWSKPYRDLTKRTIERLKLLFGYYPRWVNRRPTVRYARPTRCPPRPTNASGNLPLLKQTGRLHSPSGLITLNVRQKMTASILGLEDSSVELRCAPDGAGD